MELDRLPGVVDHGLFVNTSKLVTFIIATHKGVRVLANKPGDGEEPWWSDFHVKRPLERESIDNRIPVEH